MCASVLRQFRIRAVYFGCLNDRFGGCGGVMRICDE
jgi:tRNA-specific adenosine deaminase 2